MNSMKNSKVVSDWKPGLVSNKYRDNYDRIFKCIVITMDNLELLDEYMPYEFDRISKEEYEWKENKGEIDG